jgi:hypothetical protein
MWDLAFLVGADRDLSREEVDAVVQEYRRLSAVDAPYLMWHKRSWDIYWKISDRAKELGQRTRRSM